MADFDIKVLLAQAKDDPRFLNLTTNSLKFGSTALSNDPIVSGVDGGALPTLFASSSNTQGFFDLRVEFFIKLKESIENSITIADLISFEQKNTFKDHLGFSEFIKIKAPFNAPNELLKATDRIAFDQGKDFKDSFGIADLLQDLLHTQKIRLQELVKSKATIKRNIDIELHHGHPTSRGQKQRPLMQLAIRMRNDGPGRNNYWNSRGFSGNFVRSLGGVRQIGNGIQLAYPYSTRINGSLPVFPNTILRGTYFHSSSESNAGRTNTLTAPHYRVPGLPSQYNQSVALRAEQYRLSDGMPYALGYNPSGVVYDWDRYAPEVKKYLLDNFPFLVAGTVYWWMPGYYKDFRSFGGGIYVADPFDENRRGWSGTGDTFEELNQGELYFYEQATISYNNILLVNPSNYPDSPDFIYDTKKLKLKENSPHSTYEGSMAEAVDRIFSFGYERPAKDEKLSSAINVLNPRAKETRSRFEIGQDFIKFFQTINLPETFAKADDKLEAFKITKHVREILKETELVLNPKAVSTFERIFTSERRNSKQTINLKKELLEAIDFRAKHMELAKTEKADLTQNLLNSGKFILNLEKIKAQSTNKLSAKTTLKELINTIDLENFQINRNLFEQFDVRDLIVTPYKHQSKISKVAVKSSKSKKLDKPLSVRVDTISTRNFDTVKFLRTEGGLRSLAIKPINAYIESDKVFLETELKFDPNFRAESHFEFSKERQSKEVEKLISPPEKLDAKQITLQGKALSSNDIIGVISKDRDSGSFGDVLFTFKTQILLQYMELKERRISKDFSTPKESKKTTRENILYSGRFEELNSRARPNDLLHSFFVTKALIEKLVDIGDEELSKLIKKPIRTVGDVRDLLLTTPASSKIRLSKFLASDNFNPYLMVKKLEEDIEMFDLPAKKVKTGITETLSSSIRGHAFIRDEDYVEGAYFLQPYVATIPPGRSRQF